MTSLYLNDESCEFSCLMRTVNVTDLSHEMLGAMLDRYWLIKKKKKKSIKVPYGKKFPWKKSFIKKFPKM